MPKLPRISGRKLAAALEKAGFKRVRTEGDHCFMHNPQTGRTVTVVLTRRTLSAGLISRILKQAGLSADDLRELTRRR